MNVKWAFVIVACLSCRLTAANENSNWNSNGKNSPNIILIFTDDQGYGDLSCYGSTKIRTPNIDRMAKEGMRFTSFYSAASVCTPSRAALMTGCYPERVGNLPVLFPHSDRGLNPEETTMAEMLAAAGYRTACFGKWHLGHHPPFLPTNQGFDEYFGVPYSNDMNIDASMKLADKVNWREGMTVEKFKAGKCNGPPLMRGTKANGSAVVECPADQRTLTRRYTTEAIRFIDESIQADKPFFIYLPHTMPHIPLYASDEFRGTSAAGLYGDTLEEIDANVGDILNKLRAEKLADNTLVIYTTDNGPWELKGSKDSWVRGNMNRRVGGSAGPLRGFKFSRFEGGMRVPAVMWSPGLIPSDSTCDHLVGSIDILPTLAELADAKLPAKKIDGKSLVSILRKGNEADAVREFYFYRTEGVRNLAWKLKGKELFNLARDVGEKQNVAANNAKQMAALQVVLQRHRDDLKQNARKPATYVRPEQRITGLENWKAIRGNWKFKEGVLSQSNAQGDSLAFSPRIDSKDFVLTAKARKTGGEEAFRILIRANQNQYLRFSCGAFGNTMHSLMRVQKNNVKKRSEPFKATLENDRWYEIRIEAQGETIKCFVNGVLANQETFKWTRAGMIGLGSSRSAVEFKELRVIAGDKLLVDGWSKPK
jgi:arylsulfatase A-like enzyme